MSVPKMCDYELLSQITPMLSRLLPPTLGNSGMGLNNSVLASLRIMDEQDHIQKFKWINIPPEIDIDFIERLLYYRGSGMFFLMPNEKFYFLPWVGQNLDVYGRATKACAIPFNGTANSKQDSPEKPWITGKTWDIQYSVMLPEELKHDDLFTKCVVLSDYSRQMPQKVQPRQTLTEPILQVIAEIIPFMRTALINGVGVSGYRVQSEDSAAEVYRASNAVLNAALTGSKWIPVLNPIEQADIPESGTVTAIQDYLLAMQGIDNFRLSLHGLQNGGLFQKKAHMLGAEQEMNTIQSGRILQNGLDLRQQFCTVCNSIFGTTMWCIDPAPLMQPDMMETDEESESDDSGGEGDVL